MYIIYTHNIHVEKVRPKLKYYVICVNIGNCVISFVKSNVFYLSRKAKAMA